MPTVSSRLPMTGYDLYRLPEFRALCERIGLPWDLDTLGLTIVLPADESQRVRVYHEYALRRPPASPAADTTTLHNEKWRTKAPAADTPFVVLDVPKGVHLDDMRRWAERQANLFGREVRFAFNAVWYSAVPEGLCVELAAAEEARAACPGC